ncbi:MAG: hypothetical protein AAF957_15530 [Planctomycetota bacterium]
MSATNAVTRRFRHLALGFAIAAALFGGLVVSSRACQLCTPFPRASAADYLLAAEAVVLAREDPERPFQYAVVEVLKGDLCGMQPDLFVDSRVRRMLAVHPERSAVLTLMRLECGALSWRRVGLADEDFGPATRQILDLAASWRKDPGRRFDFFARWLGHSNPQLRDLAHIEVARAPYRSILGYRDRVSREDVHRLLGDWRRAEWHPLYILVLSTSDHTEDREWIRRSFDTSARLSMTRGLDAWAAAYVEIAGVEAIEAIEEQYFRRADRTPEELKAVVQALSVHGTAGHVHLRDRILASYSVLLDQHPERAIDLLKDLRAWKRADLDPAIAAIVSKRSDSIDVETQRQLRSHLLVQMRTSLRPVRAPGLR